MQLVVRVPGTCGELLQGTRQGEPFLVTFPINRYVTVRVDTEQPACLVGLGKKSQQALHLFLKALGRTVFPYAMSLTSELLPGKGMASSSADIAAVVLAAAAAFGEKVSIEDIACLAAAIEPTDGVLYPGVVRMNPLTGMQQESLGLLPALRVLIFDTGGEVDTLQFHQREDLAAENEKNEEILEKAWGLLRKNPCSETIGLAASYSALANQQILAKPGLPELYAFSRQMGALGINAAHSGTLLGILFSPEMSSFCLGRNARSIQQAYPALHYLGGAVLGSGGYFLQRG